MKPLHHYNPEHHSTGSADSIIPYLMEYIQPKSVLDIGCGIGQWLCSFRKHGITDVLGIDGPHVRGDDLLIPQDLFVAYDLTDLPTLSLPRAFDLVLCLEVAEHLPASLAESLVSFLTTHGKCILFSAAVPHQTGENHLNEQPPNYWSNLFNKYEYSFVDLFRKPFWNNCNVNWWYRQNIFFVTPDDEATKYSAPFDGNMYIHPRLFKLYVEKVKALESRLEMRKDQELSLMALIGAAFRATARHFRR